MAQLISLNGQPIAPSRGWCNRDLFNFFQEYNSARTTLMGMLIKNRLLEFRNANVNAYEALDKELDALQKEYFEFTEKGALKIQESAEGAAPSFVMLPGKSQKDYESALSLLLNRRVTIIWPRHVSW